MIQNRKTFEEGDNVIVKGVDRKGTVNKRKGDFYDVTLDATQEQEKNNVFAGDMVKASKSIKSMAIKQIEKYYKQGILNKREVIAILMKENGWSFPEAKQIADYYERIFNNRQIQSRFNQTNGKHLFTLSEAAQYLSALFFDLREIHFNTTGSEFYTYHELAQELYEKTEDFYDDLVETAISFDSDVSPMYVLPGDWSFITNDEDLSTDGVVYGVQNVLLDKLSTIYDILSDVQEYDSMVQSKIDSMLEYYDKEIYKLKQAIK